MTFRILFTLTLLLFSWMSFGQTKPDAESAKKYSADELLKLEQPVTTNHSLRFADGEQINFVAKAGYMLLKTETGEPRAKIFYIAYLKTGENNAANRPITVAFNGGPGSSSVWLHMGALGPRRIVMDETGNSLAPPYKVVDNEYSWLKWTDLVFVDPVMTGYSRPFEGVDKKEFLGYEEDIQAVGEFIHRFITLNKRWASPKYLAGESYGTTRAAGLSNYLMDRYGMFLNGLVLISQITNFQTARFNRGNDLPYILYLPTYAATAWYHKKLEPSFTDLQALLDEVEAFALNEYADALLQGDLLSSEEKERIAKKLARYTGLSTNYILQANLRPEIQKFCKELRRSEGLTVGRLDSRFTGTDYDDTGERYEFDPSYDKTIYGPFTTAVYDHLGTYLNYISELPYEILTGRVRPWNYSNVQNEYLNVAESLRSTMHKNPFMKVLVCNGYYDLATPYFATEYTLNHMFLDPELKKNIKMTYYEAGHMMYIHQPSLKRFTEDVREFYRLN